MKILTKNTLLVDNISEALRDCISEGNESCKMLICEIIGVDGEVYQAHINVTRNQDDFIDNSEEMPLLLHDSEYRIINKPL